MTQCCHKPIGFDWMKNKESRNVVVTGGAGYVGSVLVPKLLAHGHKVKVIDLYIYGREVLDSVKDNPNLAQITGDIRNRQFMKQELGGYDALIHLACISNDPSFELDPVLGRSINYDAFITLVEVAKEKGIKGFMAEVLFSKIGTLYGLGRRYLHFPLILT